MIATELYNLNAGQLSLNNFGDFGLLSQNLTFSKELYVEGQMVPAFDIIMVIRSNPLHPRCIGSASYLVSSSPSTTSASTRTGIVIRWTNLTFTAKY